MECKYALYIEDGDYIICELKPELNCNNEYNYPKNCDIFLEKGEKENE